MFEYTQEQMDRDRANARAFYDSITDHGRLQPTILVWDEDTDSMVPLNPSLYDMS